MTQEHFDSLGITLEEYYNLPKEELMEINKEFMYNPFDERIRRNEIPTANPFQYKLYGPWKDGIHLMANPFNFHFVKKFEVKNMEIIRAWDVTDDYKWKKIPLHTIKGYTDDEWNETLTDEERRGMMRLTLYDPFNIPEGVPMMNPFTFEVVNGDVEDGDWIMYHPKTGQTWKKLVGKNGVVGQVFNYNLENKEWIEMPKPWGLGEGENN
jgi:hypothetical protein